MININKPINGTTLILKFNGERNNCESHILQIPQDAQEYTNLAHTKQGDVDSFTLLGKKR